MPTVDSLDIQITTSATSADKALDKLANTIASVQRQLGKTNSVSGFNSLRTATTRLNNDLVKTQKVSKSTTAGFGKMIISVNALKKVFDGLGKSIKSSMDYIETLNYFNNAWAQVAEKADLSVFEDLGYETADAYVKSFSERARQVTSQLTGFNVLEDGSLTSTGKVSLGIDPNQVMNYQAMFGQMASSIGLTSENSLLLSEALTKIGADLASVKNMDFDKVWKDMASGLAGMSRTLDKYGVNIRNVNLQQKLLDLGINANIANLNQNEKAMLRTIILLESTGYAYGDLAETINAPANQLRLLKANFTNLARTIGNLFLPVVQTVLPYINGLVIALQRLFTWVGSLIGLDFSDLTSSVNSVGGSDFSDLIDDTDDLTDGMDKASKSAKKMKDYLLGIDELNVIKPEEDSGTDALSGIGASGGLLDDAFKNAINDYLSAWDKAFADLENRANEIADKIQAFALKVWEFIKPFREALLRFWESFQQVIDFVATALEDFWENFLKPLLEWAFGEEDKGITAFLNTLSDLIDKIDWEALNSALKDLWIALEPFVEKVGDGLNWFFREVLSPFAQFLINSVLIDVIEALADAFEVLNDVIEFLAPIVKEFWEEFGKEAYAETLEKIASAVDSLIAPFESLSDLLDDFSWDNFLKYAKDVADFALLLTNPVAYFATRKDKEGSGNHESVSGQSYGGAGKSRSENTGSFAESLEKLKNGFNNFFKDIGTSATNFFDDLYANKLKEFVKNTSEKWQEWKKAISDKLKETKEVISKKWQEIKTNTTEFLQNMLSNIREKWESIKSDIAEKVKNIFSKISEGWENIKRNTIDFLTELRNKIQTTWENIKNKITEVLNNIKTTVSTVWNNVKTTISTVLNSIKTNITTVWSNIKTAITNTVKNIYDSVSEKFKAVKDAIESAMKNASSAIDTFKESVNNAISKIKDFFDWSDKDFKISLPTDIFDGFIEKVSGAISKLKDLFDFDGRSVNVSSNVSGGGSIRGYATGGYPASASLFWAGENGVPEILGTVGGRTAVAGGAEITGIRDAVYSTGQAETALLQTAVNLLQIIADKDQSINIDGRDLVSAYDARKNRNGYVF